MRLVAHPAIHLYIIDEREYHELRVHRAQSIHSFVFSHTRKLLNAYSDEDKSRIGLSGTVKALNLAFSFTSVPYSMRFASSEIIFK